MNKLYLHLALVLVVCACDPAPVPPPVAAPRTEAPKQDTAAVQLGHKYRIESQVLGETREYWVALPETYAENGGGQFAPPKKYPVLYLLDGDGHFVSTAGVVRHMSTGRNGNRQIPEMIIVALPNTNRTRDLSPSAVAGRPGTGGGDRFLKFLSEELFPEIEAKHRCADHRTLVGHSLGGLLAVHALVQHPGLFDAHLAIDPSLFWDDQLMLRNAQRALPGRKKLAGQVYISAADNRIPGVDDPRLSKKPVEDFANYLKKYQSPKFSSEMRYFGDESHGSVPLVSMYYGLRSIFAGYEFRLQGEPPSAEVLKAHFARVSGRLDVELFPPESLVNRIGYHFMERQKKYEAAVAMFRLNAEYYPHSANVHDSLGEGLAALGQKKQAIESYRKALEIDPGNDDARQRIARLERELAGD